MIRFKSSVNVPKSAVILAAAANAATRLGLPGDVYVTSGNDSKHMVGSRHYSDEALDFRTRHLTKAQAQSWCEATALRLGPDYQAVVESDHLHVEYDPARA